jgi:small basic protein (TIGR04137 family)
MKPQDASPNPPCGILLQMFDSPLTWVPFIGIRYLRDFYFLFLFMSQHASLKGASTIVAKRNVLKRFERVELLKKRGKFKDGDKVIGLPKTKPDA